MIFARAARSTLAICALMALSGACRRGASAPRTQAEPADDDARFAALLPVETQMHWPATAGRATPPRALALYLALAPSGLYAGVRAADTTPQRWDRIDAVESPLRSAHLRERLGAFTRTDGPAGGGVTLLVDTTLTARHLAETLAVLSSYPNATPRILGRGARSPVTYGGVGLASSLASVGGDEARRVPVLSVRADGARLAGGGPCGADRTRACATSDAPVRTAGECGALLDRGVSGEAPARLLVVETAPSEPVAALLAALFACHAAPTVARRALHPRVAPEPLVCTEAGRVACASDEVDRVVQTRAAEEQLDRMIQTLFNAGDGGARPQR